LKKMTRFGQRTALVAALAAAFAWAENPPTKTKDGVVEIDLATLTHPPLWEPTLEEYFPVQRGNTDKDEHGLGSPMTLTSPTHDEFVYHVRKGYPIVVSDWAKGMIYNKWTGADFAKEFPFGYMKAEYIDHMKGFKAKQHDIKMIDGEKRFNMGTFKPNTKIPWHNFSRPASKSYKDDPQKPETGPYVWHVKDELKGNQKKLVQARFEAPPFLNDNLNKDFMNTTFEMWFSPGKGAGAGAHNDGYCESVVSISLRGEKKWRKMLEPEMTFFDSYDEFDGGIYKAGKWNPDLGFVLKPGGAIIWPPGYLHETRTLPPADGECGTAITLQFAFPQPVQFLRAFLPRLALSAEVGQCLGFEGKAWGDYAYMFVKGIKPNPKQENMQKQKETILKTLDSDGDGKITVDEVIKHFKSGQASPGLAGRKESYSKKDFELFYRFLAEDTVAYHDKDDDMVVSTQELWDSLVQWNVVRVRMFNGLKLVNSADKKGLEEYERSLDVLRRKPATFPEKMRPELKALFSLKKGTKIFAKQPKSFSDQEFFGSVRDRLTKLGANAGDEEL